MGKLRQNTTRRTAPRGVNTLSQEEISTLMGLRIGLENKNSFLRL